MGSMIEPPGCVWRPGMFWPAADKKRQFPQEYGSWNSARRRCHDPENAVFPRYGGRGITMCPEWFVSFDAFIAHLGPKPSPQHSVDRIDNDRGYEPGNVRWATAATQAANRRLPGELLPRRGQETMAEMLRAAGWTVIPPDEPRSQP